MSLRSAARAAAALSAMALVPAMAIAQTASRADCWLPDELSAARMQHFQTMLMIGALKCRNSLPEAMDSYNDFVNRKQDLIDANQFVIRAHFIRQYGAQTGNAAFRDFQTSMGNRHSADGLLSRCASVRSLSRLAANSSDSDLLELAGIVVEDSAVTVCPAGPNGAAPVAAAGTAELAALPVAADAAAPPQPAGAAATGDETPSAPAAAPAADAKPAAPQQVAMTAAAPPAPAAASAPVATEAAPPAPNAARALQDAARALAEAASALQAQSAGPAKAAGADAARPN